MTSSKRCIKPKVRIVHLNLHIQTPGRNQHRFDIKYGITKSTYPMRGMSFRAAMGYTTPPKLAPMVVKDKANPLFVVNQCGRMLKPDMIITPLDSYKMNSLILVEFY
jgi:hypothetical protein